MEKYDVVIIGAGLGGLQCAYILAKHGMKVCVLEQNRLIGGCIQTFVRKNTKFDTGFHYIGGLDEGQPLNRIFKYFDLMDLPWQKLDPDGFDQIFYRNKSYMFVNGYDRFCDKMSEYFPNSANELKTYTTFLRSVGEGIFESFDRDPEQNLSGDTLFGKNAYQYLTGTISDPVLQNVLSGTSAKLHLDKQRLPLYTFAQINSSFIQSAYRIRGGGMQIAEKLAQSITNMGGIVTTGAKATNLVESNGRISVVEIEGREPIETKYIISNIHPVATLYLAQNTSFIKKIYRKRISSLDNTFGMFTANIKLKPNTLVSFINRSGRIIIPTGSDSIEVGDSVMIVTKNKGFTTLTDIVR